jgi:hypothetical protein
MRIETMLCGLFFWSSAFAQAAPEGVLLLESGGGVCAATLLKDGAHVATAYHCVNTLRPITLRTADGQEVNAKRVATNRSLDLAVLKMDSPLPIAGLPIRSFDLAPGEPVVVYGHPFYSAGQSIPALEGLLAFSQAHGFVSAVGPYLTQLDVAFNPGMSGGPVVDADGRIAGVASRKLKGEQLSFSAPSAPLVGMQKEQHRERVSGRLSLLSDLDVPLAATQVPSLHLTPRLVLWDWVGFEASAGWEMGANWKALQTGEAHWEAWKIGTFLRFRMGQGPESLVLDLGGAQVGTMVLTGIWQEEQGFRFVRTQGAARLGPSLRLGWKGWALGVRLLKDQDHWATSISVGWVVAPQLAIF